MASRKGKGGQRAWSPWRVVPAASTPTPGWILGGSVANQRGRGGPVRGFGGGARGRGGRGSCGGGEPALTAGPPTSRLSITLKLVKRSNEDAVISS